MPFDARFAEYAFLTQDALTPSADPDLPGFAGLGSTAASSFASFEMVERTATFAASTHALLCCPCGHDHSGDLLAHKISIASFGGQTVSLTTGGPAISVQSADDGTFRQALSFPGEVSGDISTTASLSVGDTATSQVEVSADRDWFRITLQAGVTYEFRLDGSGGTPLSDPYLAIANSSGTELAFNDDGGADLNSLLRFTPTTSGTYYLDAGGWIDPNTSQSSTGGYTLSASVAPALPTYTVDQIADYLVNEGSAGGRSWGVTGISYNIEGLTADQQALAERALDAWAEITPLIFTRTTGTGDITFLNTDPDDPTSTAETAFARTTFSGNTIISSTIVISSNWFGGDTTLDSYTYQTYLHEVGHALGLGHAGPYDGSAEFGTDNIYTNDSWAFTVMSYFDQAQSGLGSYRFALAPQQADIVAIQDLYGTNPGGTRAGNTTYGFNSSAPGSIIDWSQFVVVRPEGTYVRPPAMTIFDTGGIDTINLSGFTQDQTLSLLGGTFSSLGDRPQPNQPVYTNVVAIAATTIIENAIGGSGDDRIIGNSANNTITLGSGGDTYVYAPNGGNDTITDFNTSQDFVDLTAFTAAEATAAFNGRTSISGGTQINIGGGSIYFSGIATAALTIGRFIVSSFNTINGTPGPDTLFGTSGNDEILGLDSSDFIDGRAGNDSIDGGAGNDVLVGGIGNDHVTGGAGNDTIYGNDGTDTLDGDDGVDILIGGLGIDTLNGGGGTDYVYGDDGDDIIDGGLGDDVLIGGIGSDRIETGDGFDYIYAGDGADVLTAASGTNVLIGEAGNDDITGGTGRDYLYGGDGNDTLRGGADIDILIAEAGTDILEGGDGQDYLYAGAGNDTLRGGDGVDFMLGEDGDDTLFGGRDVNYLYGGAGSDVFVQDFSAGAGVDVISDFQYGLDRIRLSGSSLANINDVRANATYNSLGFTVITTGAGTSIWLPGDVRATLAASDFEFVTSAAASGQGTDFAARFAPGSIEDARLGFLSADEFQFDFGRLGGLDAPGRPAGEAIGLARLEDFAFQSETQPSAGSPEPAHFGAPDPLEVQLQPHWPVDLAADWLLA